jgi:hypothetical protein
MKTIQPEAITLPERILKIIPPHPPAYDRSRETFQLRTGLTFDPLSAAETAADMTIQLLLNPERAARLMEHHSRDSQQPSFAEVIDKVTDTTWKAPHVSGLESAVQKNVDDVVLFRLMSLAANDAASEEVRAMAYFKLDQLKGWLQSQNKKPANDEERAHEMLAISQIERFQKDPKVVPVTKPVEPPAGMPIGVPDFCNWMEIGR